MDPGSDRVIAGPAAGVGPGEVEEGRQHPQIGRREPGVGGDVVGDGGEGDAESCIGSPGAHSPPVRSAGPRPVWSTGLWGSSRLLPPFPGVDPGLELGGGIGEHGPQHGEAAGLLLGRRRAEASRRGSVGRNFGEGIGPALALGQGLVRIMSAHKNPLPVRRVFRDSPRPVAWSAVGLGIKGIKRAPEMVWHPSRGFVAFIQRRVLTLNPLAGFAGESRRAGRDRPIYI